MNGSTFFDTNILVYCFDETDQEKHEIASDLIIQAYKQGNGVISTQVLKEFYVTVTQKVSQKMNLDTAEQAVRDFALWRVVETSVSLILRAIKLHRKHRLSFWDSMIVAAAIVSNCSSIVSEDLQHDALIEGIRIKNPFLSIS
jgi:predicted nucleic acid-binding protein